MPTQPTPRRDLPRLTSLRAFAALAVFFFHIGHDTEWGPGGITFLHGFVGVGFFYILSGFVLAWSTRPDTSSKSFWWKRFARIYPSYFVMFLIAFVAPRLAYPVTPEAAITNALLIQAWFPQWHIAFGMNAVSWSLSCEAFFYLCTPWVLRWAHRQSDRGIVLVLGAWTVSMILIALAMSTDARADVYAYTNPLIRSGEFTLGIAAALLVMRGRIPRIPVVAGVAAVAAVAFLTNGRLLPQSFTDVVFVVPFLILILAGATTDIAGRRGLLTTRPLVYAGQVSYCFYLVHELVILNGEPLWGGWAHTTGERVALVVAVLAIAFGAAAALHHLVELPMQRLIRQRFDSRPSQARGSAA